jgi:hypothetical protein
MSMVLMGLPNGKEAEEKQVRQLNIKRRSLTIKTIIEKECASAGLSHIEVGSGSRRKIVSKTEQG